MYRLGLAQPAVALADVALQVAVLAELQEHVEVVLGLAVVVQLHDVGRGQHRGVLDLVLDLLALVLVEGLDVDLLDRDVGVGARLLAQEHLAHHAVAQHVLEVHLVLADDLRFHFHTGLLY